MQCVRARMRDVMLHRGPDGLGPVGRHATRSSRTSVSASSISPAAISRSRTKTARVWVTYNGEIYNHRDVRAELESAGHRYRTRSDTETIVHAYEQWGDDCVHRFRGMFAFGLWDAPKRRLLLVRDRLGRQAALLGARGRRPGLRLRDQEHSRERPRSTSAPNHEVLSEVLATRSTAGDGNAVRRDPQAAAGSPAGLRRWARAGSSSTGTCRSTDPIPALERVGRPDARRSLPRAARGVGAPAVDG